MFQSAADLIAGTVDMPDSDAASEVEENANRSSSQAATSRSEPSVESDRSHENISDAEMSTPAHIRGDDPRYQGKLTLVFALAMSLLMLSQDVIFHVISFHLYQLYGI